MTISPALAAEIADLLGHAPRRGEADRRQAIIEALRGHGFTEDGWVIVARTIAGQIG